VTGDTCAKSIGPHASCSPGTSPPEWKFDPDPAKTTEFEVLFNAEEDQTRVTLQYRGFEVHGEAGPAMRESVDSDGGWSSLLEMYRRAA
jgi:hypothetical protein